MCTRPIRINGFTLPCGKCPECLKAQELTLGFYGIANANKYTSVASITLSYDDNHIPLVSNTLVIDHVSKTYRSLYDYNITSPSLFDFTRTPILEVPHDESKPIKSKITPREKSRFERLTFGCSKRLREVFIFT